MCRSDEAKCARGSRWGSSVWSPAHVARTCRHMHRVFQYSAANEDGEKGRGGTGVLVFPQKLRFRVYGTRRARGKHMREQREPPVHRHFVEGHSVFHEHIEHVQAVHFVGLVHILDRKVCEQAHPCTSSHQAQAPSGRLAFSHANTRVQPRRHFPVAREGNPCLLLTSFRQHRARACRRQCMCVPQRRSSCRRSYAVHGSNRSGTPRTMHT